ncbi:MAG TPA: hypothetical protein VJ852_10810 [Gemmatimonadaceae bacterium]|nr:hypothetical protein [Gemmatimonadaceae bacterium]
MTKPAAKPSAIEIARIIEHTEAAACADLLRAAPPDWNCSAQRTEDGWFLCAPTLDILLFNRLVGWGLDAPAVRRPLEHAIERYRSVGLTRFGVQLSPEARPRDLPRWLEDFGLERRDNWTKVYRDAGDIPAVSTDLRIEQIDKRRGPAFGDVVVSAFGMPTVMAGWLAASVGRSGWNHYLAFDGKNPVAAAALYVVGDVGWLGVAGTLPTARRRGAQSALMARRLKDGVDLGCRWFVTETGEDTPARRNPSFHNMLRLGFSVAYHRPNYLLPK